ncbi:MAG: hypothetical protein LUF32_04885 [Clostridiales bacterium]|nr:hypothetical protein [Clostridiales bacterium]
MRNRIFNRGLAAILTLFLAVVLIPGTAWGTESGTETQTEETIWLTFGSDRHGNGTALTEILSAIVDTVDSTEDGSIDFVGLDGDMVDGTASYSTSTLISEIQAVGLTDAGGAAVQGATPVVGLAYGSHDAGVNDDAGIMLSEYDGSGLYYETDSYIIYIIGYDDMISVSAAATAAETFTETIADEDSSRALFIMSHVPLHQRRGDNRGAAVWLETINTAAERFDTVFLWGHNHTGETSADTAVYCVTPGNSITPQGGEGAVTLNFTYVNAGYIKYNGEMSLIGLTEDTISVQKYTADGASGETVMVARYDHESQDEITLSIQSDATLFYVGDVFSADDFTVTDSCGNILNSGDDYTYALDTACAEENEDGSWYFTAATDSCTLTVNGVGEYAGLVCTQELTVAEAAVDDETDDAESENTEGTAETEETGNTTEEIEDTDDSEEADNSQTTEESEDTADSEDEEAESEQEVSADTTRQDTLPPGTGDTVLWCWLAALLIGAGVLVKCVKKDI